MGAITLQGKIINLDEMRKGLPFKGGYLKTTEHLKVKVREGTPLGTLQDTIGYFMGALSGDLLDDIAFGRVKVSALFVPKVNLTHILFLDLEGDGGANREEVVSIELHDSLYDLADGGPLSLHLKDEILSELESILNSTKGGELNSAN